MKFIVLSLALFSPLSFAHEARLEAGVLETKSNRFNIPNPGGSRVLVKDSKAKVYARAQGTFQVSDSGFVRVLVAPLETKYKYNTATTLLYNGVSFPAGSNVDVVYQFNSYRLGYLYRFLSTDTFQMRGGLIGKIRQAKISLSGAGTTSTYKNVGFVPLFNLGFAWNFWSPLELRFDIDGAAAKQGRAFDGSLELFYGFNEEGSGLSLGARVLEGGADNTKVNTFALLHYAYLAATWGF